MTLLGWIDQGGLPEWVSLWQPRWCNCRIWAWYMEKRYGGYICQRQSVVFWKWHANGRAHEAFWRHAVWTLDHKLFWEYTPVTEKPTYLLVWKLPLIVLFRGRAKIVSRGGVNV